MEVDIVKRVREHLALNAWGMAKLMGRKIQSYQHLERNSKRMSIVDLDLIYTVSGVSPEAFIRWINAAANAENKKKKKKKV